VITLEPREKLDELKRILTLGTIPNKREKGRDKRGEPIDYF
jgi:hypothetical protein